MLSASTLKIALVEAVKKGRVVITCSSWAPCSSTVRTGAKVGKKKGLLQYMRMLEPMSLSLLLLSLSQYGICFANVELEGVVQFP